MSDHSLQANQLRLTMNSLPRDGSDTLGGSMLFRCTSNKRGFSMSSLPFIAALVCIGIIIFWYVRDEAVRGGKGNGGLLDVSTTKRRSERAGGPGWKSTGKRPWRPGR
jgi:hypothetical protein